MKFIRIILFLVVFVLLLAACNPSEAEDDTKTSQSEISSPTLTATLTPTYTLTNSPTASQTSTVTPSQTATLTLTPSPTEIIVFVTNANELALRTGPGIYYELITLYPEGTDVIVLGTEPARKWFHVRVVKDGKIGWMFSEYLTIDPRLLEFIPVVDATPTPKPINLPPNATTNLTATQECKWLRNKGTPCP